MEDEREERAEGVGEPCEVVGHAEADCAQQLVPQANPGFML